MNNKTTSAPYATLHQHYRDAGLARHAPPQHLRHYSTYSPLNDEDQAHCGMACEIIVRAGILTHQGNPEGPHHFTNLGWAFINACQKPNA